MLARLRLEDRDSALAWLSTQLVRQLGNPPCTRGGVDTLGTLRVPAGQDLSPDISRQAPTFWRGL